jgi:hypothetical protein
MIKVSRKIYQCYIQGVLEKDQQAWLKKSDLQNLFYVYIKLLPDGTVFWVGKGHGFRAFSLYSRNSYYRSIVNKYGEEHLKTTIFPFLSEEEAFLKEIKYTAYFKALGCKLANMTFGGEGGAGRIPWNKGKSCENISRALLGRSLSQEHRDSISEGLKGHSSWSKGKKFTPEQCDNVSKSLKGKPKPPGYSQTLSKMKKGQVPWNKGRKMPPEYGVNISNGRQAGKSGMKRNPKAYPNHIKSGF